MIDVERSQPAPTSLAKRKTYRGDDVRARLRDDFYRKCYLCEGNLGLSFEVDHRQPTSAGGNEYDWDNLYRGGSDPELRQVIEMAEESDE